MTKIEFDDEIAAKLEAAYLGADVVAQRADTLQRLALQPGETVLDIGSGPGFLAAEMADQVGPSGKVLGVDISPQMVARATGRNDRAWLSYLQGDATALPVPDASFDVAVSTQVAEYVPNIAQFCTEAYRVLKPGGRALVLATDWDSIAWHTADPDRMQRVMAAFAPHCADIRLPRTLAPHLRAAGFDVDTVNCFPIINMQRYEGAYSSAMANLIANYVTSQGTISQDEADAWLAEQAELDRKQEYFFFTTRFIFQASKPRA